MAIFPGWQPHAGDLAAIDRELAKLAHALHVAVTNPDRHLALMADCDDMLDRRLLLRSASV